MTEERLEEDLKVIRTPEHLTRMHDALERHFEEWAMRYAAEGVVGDGRFQRGRGIRRNDSARSVDRADRLATLSNEAIGDYTAFRENNYAALLDPEVLEEFAGQERLFVKEAERRFPVLRHALHCEAKVMAWWQKRFRMVARRKPGAVVELVRELVHFAREYCATHDPEDVVLAASPGELGLDALVVPPSEEGEGASWDCAAAAGRVGSACLAIPGAIGTGITSTLLYYLAPAFFPARNRDLMKSMYFLLGRETGLLEDSEFLLWSTGTGNLGHNHRYPYDLFVYHLLGISRRLEEFHARLGVPFDRAHRMVHVSSLLYFIAEANREETDSWSDQDGF